MRKPAHISCINLHKFGYMHLPVKLKCLVHGFDQAPCRCYKKLAKLT